MKGSGVIHPDESGTSHVARTVSLRTVSLTQGQPTVISVRQPRRANSREGTTHEDDEGNEARHPGHHDRGDDRPRYRILGSGGHIAHVRVATRLRIVGPASTRAVMHSGMLAA